MIYSLAVSTLFLLSCCSWRTPPIESLRGDLVFLGITRTTWLTNAEHWWAIPGRAHFLAGLGWTMAGLGLIGAIEHGKRSSLPDANAYFTTLLGLLVAWQSTRVDLVHLLYGPALFLLVFLWPYIWFSRQDPELPPAYLVLGFHLLNAFYVIFWLSTVILGSPPLPARRDEGKQAS